MGEELASSSTFVLQLLLEAILRPMMYADSVLAIPKTPEKVQARAVGNNSHLY